MLRLTTVRSRGFALVAVFALAVAACGGGGSKSSTSSGGGGGGVKLGFFGALTGANAQLGINEFNGLNLAVTQHNKKSGAKKVQLIRYDSQGDPAIAPTLAQKVISDKTVAIVGPAFSGESKVADPIFQQAGIVNVTCSATNPKLADNGWTYWHRSVANDSNQGPAGAKYLVKKLNAKNIAVVDDNEEYSLGLADIVRQTLPSLGAKVAVSDHIDKNAQDYSATVNKIKSASPDAIYYGGYYSEGGRFLKQLRDAGITVPWVSDDGAADPKLISGAGAAAAEGAYVTNVSGDATKNPNAATFVSDYKALSGTDPGTYSAECYDTANMMLQGIDAGKTTSKAINDYLASSTYTGITSTIKFDSKGQVTTPTIYLYKVVSGNLSYEGVVDQLVGA
jgi:branched-chain amino acid transport system substrate-binding protein